MERLLNNVVPAGASTRVWVLQGGSTSSGLEVKAGFLQSQHHFHLSSYVRTNSSESGMAKL